MQPTDGGAVIEEIVVAVGDGCGGEGEAAAGAERAGEAEAGAERAGEAEAGAREGEGAAPPATSPATNAI